MCGNFYNYCVVFETKGVSINGGGGIPAFRIGLDQNWRSRMLSPEIPFSIGGIIILYGLNQGEDSHDRTENPNPTKQKSELGRIRESVLYHTREFYTSIILYNTILEYVVKVFVI